MGDAQTIINLKEAEKKAAEKLNHLDIDDGDYWDAEPVHIAADEIILEALREGGMPKVAEAYETLRKRITFWYA